MELRDASFILLIECQNVTFCIVNKLRVVYNLYYIYQLLLKGAFIKCKIKSKALHLTLFNTYVDLIVIHLSCSSFLVSVNRISPALLGAIIPALDTRESVKVDFP